MIYKFEYIWLDGYLPLPNIRSKTAIKEIITPADLSLSSTDFILLFKNKNLKP